MISCHSLYYLDFDLESLLETVSSLTLSTVLRLTP